MRHTEGIAPRRPRERMDITLENHVHRLASRKIAMYLGSLVGGLPSAGFGESASGKGRGEGGVGRSFDTGGAECVV